MASVTFDPAVGGDGSTVTDDSNAATGLGNGGHRTRFVPALANTVAVAGYVKTRADEAAESARTALNAPGTTATSTSTLSLLLGAVGLTIQTGKSIVVGMTLKAAATASPTNWLAGEVTAYDPGTGALTLNAVLLSGSGTFSAWTVSLSGPALLGVARTGDTMLGALILKGNPEQALEAAPKQYVDALIPRVDYDNRGTLRAMAPIAGALALVNVLGLFRWEAASSEPDDDESCFATASGCWLLMAPSWDLADAWALPDNEYRDAFNEDTASALLAIPTPAARAAEFGASYAAKVLLGTAASAVTSIAGSTQISFTGIVTGAAVGDRVLATPPSAMPVATSAHARVTAPDTVTVYINNTSVSTVTYTVGTWNLAVFK